MGFSFYPKHEQNCPNVSHCPHLGGAALGTLVLMATANSAATSPTEKKKRGAPVGHPGWFRKTPEAYDWAVDVAAPKRCPHCDGTIGVFDVHADETYWTLNGDRAFYWVHCDASFAHFQFNTSRNGQVSRDVLGEHFTGSLPPTNNMAERALRPLVVLRKITFGHRSHAVIPVMQVPFEGGRLMTVAETAKRHGHRPSDIYYGRFTQPPGRVLRQLNDDS